MTQHTCIAVAVAVHVPVAVAVRDSKIHTYMYVHVCNVHMNVCMYNRTFIYSCTAVCNSMTILIHIMFFFFEILRRKKNNMKNTIKMRQIKMRQK